MKQKQKDFITVAVSVVVLTSGVIAIISSLLFLSLTYYSKYNLEDSKQTSKIINIEEDYQQRLAVFTLQENSKVLK